MQVQQVSGNSEPMPHRRIFLGSAVAIGLGSAVGGGLLIQQSTSAQTLDGEDELDSELRQQLREGLKGMRGKKRGESARKVASTLRITAAHYRARDLDSAFKRHLRARIRKEGKDAVLRQELNPQMIAAEMKQFGITTPPAFGPVDYALREKVLGDLLSGGLTPLMVAGAEQLARLSVDIDAQPPIALARAQHHFGCPDLTNQIRIIEITLMAACLWNPIACVVITGMYTGLLIGLMTQGC